MAEFQITEETRHYVDAILHTFTFPQRINNIRGAIRDVVRSEHGDVSDANIDRLYFPVIRFLSTHGFGHEQDYVYIIDEKGMKLKAAGSLSAFEKTELD